MNVGIDVGILLEPLRWVATGAIVMSYLHRKDPTTARKLLTSSRLCVELGPRAYQFALSGQLIDALEIESRER